jgi:hypothetical protein
MISFVLVNGLNITSSIDNIFVLYAFFELLKLKKKKLFVTFVDFEKAFDKVWRDGTFNLVSNTAVNNLPKQLKIVIGRNFFGSK